jgi:eukaryotic-like serine/threonine-protein kinase
VKARLTPARRKMLDRLLDRSLEMVPDERERFVAECRERAPRLGSWLEKLLRAVDEPAQFLERSARDLVGEALDERERRNSKPISAGICLGPWRIIELVGTGGMGEVYRAERADGAFKMQVAIKVIRHVSDQLAELLAAERQVMARINHAAIARLLDGGMTGDGRPYLVMEWVDGPTLDEWIAGNPPSRDRMLEVFCDTCTAVSAAHRQLVVHGDIKPSNLIVTAEGQIRLLDFGVAKLLDAGSGAELSDALTPGFSAPEQLAAQPVNTAADIYSLGALLHWMVFGAPPGRGDRLLPAWRDFGRLRDLRAIIAQATASEPDQRYATANALLLDIQRLCDSLPVRARSPSPPERLSLWVRRHRLAAVLGGLALASILIGVSATAWQARLVALERDMAQTEAALSEAVREHLLFLFREVGGLAEDTGELTARELLDRTADVAEDWLSEDPVVQQQVLAVLGEIMIALHDYASAEPLLAGFVEYDDEQISPVLRSMAFRDLAQVYHRQGRMQDGFAVINQALAILDEFPGQHPTRRSDILQIRGRLHRDLGRWDEAVDDLRRARELAVESSPGPWPLMARAENNLGTTLLIGGRLEEATRHLEAAEALWYAMGRGDSNDALSVMSNLALTLDRLGRSIEAERRLRRVIEIREQKYGDSGAMAAARIHLGRLLTVRGDHEEAEFHLTAARDVARRFVGEESPDHGAALIGLGELAFARGRYRQAATYFEESFRIMDNRLGSTHPYSLQAVLEVTNVKVRIDPDIGIDAYSPVIEQARSIGGAGRTVLSAALCSYATRAIEKARYQAARKAAEECLELRQELALGGWRVTEPAVLVELAVSREGDESGIDQALREQLQRLAGQTHDDHYLVRLALAGAGERVALP